MLSAELIDDLAALDPHRAAWDGLAIAAGRPFAAPDWVLPWWRHAAPAGAGLRVVLVHDGPRLAGVAPFFAQRKRGRLDLRLLGAHASHRIGLVAAPGEEAAVAMAAGRALAAARPRADVLALEGIEARAAWIAPLGRALAPLGATTLQRAVKPAPVLELAPGGFDAWFAGRGKWFRRDMRRVERRLAERGGRVRVTATEDELDADLAALARLHRARWDPRGGSATMSPDVERAVAEAARALLPSGRLRLYVAEVDGAAVGALLCVTAGGETGAWNSGMDDAYADLRPALVLFLAAIRDGFAHGERRFDFGGGGQLYKRKFTDEDDPIAWSELLPRGGRYPLTRLLRLPGDAARLRSAARERLARRGDAPDAADGG